MDDTEAFNEFIANTADDLFADDDENDYLNEDYYNQSGTSANVDEFLRKKNAKYGPFTTTTFWTRTDNAKHDIKNHLWDFMVYNNIREHAFNNYKSKVEMMRSELMLNIINCKKNILDVPVTSKYKGLTSEEIEGCFDKLISDLLEIYGVNLKTSEFTSKNISENKVGRQVEEYVGSHISVIQLDREIREYKKRKIDLVKSSLYQLLKSFNEFRNKILQEVYQDSKGGKMDLTRFVKNMDKVTSRFDFFGEYRFHNIRTYYKNKEQLDNFVENYIAFNEFTNDFTQFVNTFNPNYSSNHFDTHGKSDASGGKMETDNKSSSSTVADNDYTPTGYGAKESVSGGSTGRSTRPEMGTTSTHDSNKKATDAVPEYGMEADINEIFDYMGGVQSQNYVETQEAEMDEHKQEEKEDRKGSEKVTEVPEVTEDSKSEDEAENMRLLQEARKKAAEILRLKRIQRMQPQ